MYDEYAVASSVKDAENKLKSVFGVSAPDRFKLGQIVYNPYANHFCDRLFEYKRKPELVAMMVLGFLLKTGVSWFRSHQVGSKIPHSSRPRAVLIKGDKNVIVLGYEFMRNGTLEVWPITVYGTNEPEIKKWATVHHFTESDLLSALERR